METRARVYLVDDEPEVLKSLQWLVESVGYNVKGFSGGEEFLGEYNEDPSTPSCLVLDIRMPKMCGLELQENLNKKNYRIPIIFMTGHGDIAMAVRGMKAGAIDFLTKPINNQMLLEAINRALRLDEANGDEVNSRENALSKFHHLTPREREVLAFVSDGETTKLIADKLNISVNTCELHRANMMQKMEVKSIAKLVSLVLTHDLLSETQAE